MPTPKVKLITGIIDATSLEANFSHRTLQCAGHPGSSTGGDILDVHPFPGAHDDIANTAAIEAGASKPPAGVQIDARRALADHERVARPVRNGGEIDFPLLGLVAVHENAVVLRRLRNS